MKNCPTQINKVAVPVPAIKRGPNARVCSLNERDIATGPSTSVSGQLSISILFLYTLLDSGAIHYMIHLDLCDNLDSNE